MTIPTMGMTVHSPPNQCWTAEYQSKVNGRKTNPRIGQRTVLKTPTNQLEQNQTTKIVIRGTNKANSINNNGIP